MINNITKLDSKKRNLLKALKESLGIVTTACDSLSISRTTYYNWLNNDNEFKEQVDDIQNIALDFAESALYKQIKEGNHISTIFYLKTKGRKRGYSEHVQIDSNVKTSGWVVQTETLSLEAWEEMARISHESQQKAMEALIGDRKVTT